MVNNIPVIDGSLPEPQGIRPRKPLLPSDIGVERAPNDRLQLSRNVPTADALNLVRERAFEKLRQVVDNARADLGLPEGQVLDTTPEATADRIVNFALRFFGKYAENNGLADDEAGRQKFADFIGGAIGQGINEAREILDGLSVLSPDIKNNIQKTADVIGERLAEFVKKGL